MVLPGWSTQQEIATGAMKRSNDDKDFGIRAADSSKGLRVHHGAIQGVAATDVQAR